MTTTPYGVTWASSDHTVAQTGYVYGTVEDADTAARRGPFAETHQVDGLCDHYPRPCWTTLFGRIETEDDSVYEVTVREARLRRSLRRLRRRP